MRLFKTARLLEGVALPLALLAGLSTPALAADDGPRLLAHVNGVRSDATESKALNVANLAVRVTLRGSIAETEVTATFDNPGKQVLEGTFTLDMPRGSVVTGYALDINGTLVDGVLESRYKAQEAYQSRVAVRVDPGLAEVDYSDRFETRIFPINPGAGRTVRLRFVTPLDPKDGYRLPLALDGKVGTFTLAIKASGLETAPRIGLPAGVTGTWTDGALDARGAAVKLGGALTIAAPRGDDALVVSEHPGEGRFFELSGSLPPAGPQPVRARAVHVLWDRSVSRTDDALAAERDLLADWLQAVGAEQVSVTLFDSAAPETVADLSPDAALKLIAGQRYRGGTSYAGLAGITVAAGAPCLLFSDGRGTLDRRDGLKLPCAVRAVASGPEVDRAWLAEFTGNPVVELDGKNRSAALALLLGPASPVVALRDEAGRAVDHALLEAAPGAWRIVGRMPDGGGLKLVVNGTNGKPVERLYRPSSPALPTFAGPGALWASRRLAAIGDDDGPDERIGFARRFQVASPQASFVVLETPEDYARSNIAPPQSYPKDLQARYAQARDREARLKADRQQALRGKVQREWADYSAWAESKYDPDAKPDRKVRQEADADGQGENIIVTAQQRVEGAPEPRRVRRPDAPPPPPPPPVAASPAPAITVTGERRAAALQDVPVAVTAVGSAAVEASQGGEAPQGDGGIAVEPWSADRPYIAAFEKAGDGYDAAIDAMRAKHGAIPLFWFDVAEWHFSHGRSAEAIRAAEAALDLPVRDNQTLQIVAARLLRYGAHDRAIALLERLVKLEEGRPQPRRTLALALVERAKTRKGDARTADLKRALALLTEVIDTDWPDQYRGVHTIALVEANRLIAQLGGAQASGTTLESALIRSVDADLRVTAEWNTPRTDIDLWVREPGGEEVGYSHTRSARGGRYNADVTQGYGPEEYTLRKAGKGEYEIRAKTFSADRNNPNGPSTLTLRITRDFARPTEREELIDVEMKPEESGMRLVGRVKVD